MPAVVQSARGRRLLLYGEPWVTYLKMLRAFDGRRSIRITFDRGALEIMTVPASHEAFRHLVGTLILLLAYELNISIRGRGSLTFKCRRKKRGLEPDECYWIQNEARMRAVKTFEWRKDPPPDLVVEIEISHSALNRLKIYAALGVPEVWRFDGVRILVCILGPDGKYVVQERSNAFPFLRPADLLPFVAQADTVGETGMADAFRAWVRQQATNGRQTL
jgi:Uma2 family endonuclease